VITSMYSLANEPTLSSTVSNHTNYDQLSVEVGGKLATYGLMWL
jgi:hypothetical protein